MASETDRQTGVKKIPIPGLSTNEDDNDDLKVKVPCIMKITFADLVRKGQETTFTHDNSENGDREVHTDQVKSVDEDGNENGDEFMEVERIDKWKTTDTVRKGQETQFSPDNVTGNDTKPPSFTTHQKTQVIRHYQDPEN